MKKMSKEQLTLSVSLAVCAPPRALSHLPTPFPNAVFYPTPPLSPSPWLFKDPDSLFSHLPPALLPSRPEHRARLTWMYSRREPTRPVDFFFLTALSARNPAEASAPSHDEPTALPLLHSQEIAVRDYLFWGEPHLFFKWPYLSQIKETLGDNWGRDCFFSSGFWNFSVGVIVGLVVMKAPFFLSLRTLGICCLVLLAGGVSIMSKASVP